VWRNNGQCRRNAVIVGRTRTVAVRRADFPRSAQTLPPSPRASESIPVCPCRRTAGVVARGEYPSGRSATRGTPSSEKQRLCLPEGKTVRFEQRPVYSRLPSLVPESTNRSTARTGPRPAVRTRGRKSVISLRESTRIPVE